MTTRRPKTPKRKRRKTTGEAASRRSAAHLQKQLDRRTRELAKTRKLLKEALQQQSATSEVLQVINSSAVELASVFDAMLKRAMRLCEAAFGGLWVFEGDRYVAQALCGVPPAYASYLRNMNLVPGPHTAPYRFLQGERSAIQNVDLAAEEPYLTGDPQRRALVDLGGARAALQVPLVRDELVLGVITVYRQEVRPFSEQQVTLLQNFADQAVIAIENARLFNETQEALERQTATAEILKVIASSPSDVQPVFDAIASSATRLIGGFSSTVILFIDGVAHLKALTSTTPEADEILKSVFPRPTADFPPFQNARIGEIEQIADTEVMPNELRGLARARGYRSVVFAPLENKGALIGVIGVTRVQPGPFSEHHLQLLRTFADQAVIAIENTRLFNEVQERTVELSEALEQQTATAEVLGVISSSAGDLVPVFDAMLGKAMELCGASFGVLTTFDGSRVQTAATYGLPPAYEEYRRTRHSLEYGPGTGLYRLLQGEPFAEIEDLVGSEPYVRGDPNRRALVELGGARCLLTVPLLNDDRIVGFVMIFRQERKRFSEKQITLLKQFAAQAVIAIENARLLRELRQRTDDLSEALVHQISSGNILKVIASSPTDVGPALKAIVDSACEICGANDAVVLLKEGYDLVFSAHHGPVPFGWQRLPINPRWITGRAVIDKVTLHVHDVLGPEGDDFSEGRELLRRDGLRTVLSVPLLREDEAIGAIVLRRMEVHPFNDKQIELLQSFADQAVIAISNVRLFEQVQERTRELSKSLEDLRTAQDRLIQTEKLASLGQLTAGIAHEIKNPLNFVNNFSALSIELTDELNDILKQAEFAEKIRKEVDELTRLLKENLEKVVQHGKRADSIVKNMLLHSREGSGERRSADINALVGESLNLAYHGARAEKPGFTITLKHDLDPNAGALDLYPQEIIRALLNLISNGFYAATRRKAEVDNDNFEPVLSATTRGLGETVEIRIRDNGTGISPEVREKIFNPFFTTKPTGEGTGLGLSMTHDIIVKQHGGSIDVETEPGSFTEFIITLPR